MSAAETITLRIWRWLFFAGFVWLAVCLPALAQSAQAPPSTTPPTANQDFVDGMAMAGAQRWADAERLFEEGSRLAPRDERFPVELAGVAYKEKRNALAERRLQAALCLAPRDTYASVFLATLYFLDGNLEAALKYWNYVGKPRIVNVRTDPDLRVSPALLDHAFAFAPASTLELPQYLATESRLRGLGIFPTFQLDLDALPDNSYGMVLRARELNGMGGAGSGGADWMNALIALRGIPFEEVEPGLWNLRREAINLNSMLRWDKEKRRAFAQLSGPWQGGAKVRWEWGTDLRNENWAIRNSFTGLAPVLASFNMRTEKGRFDFASYASGNFGWRVGAEVSHRDFRIVAPGTVLTPPMLAEGFELKPSAQFTGVLWRVPEHRFTLSSVADSEAARLWSTPSQSFEKLAGSLAWRWFPLRKGDDYETAQQLRVGCIFGEAPFDELYILGLERDNDLPMHAHIGTRDGLKGSAPLGREYFLENWELNKNLYANGILKISLGPLLDVGRIADPGSAQGSVPGGTALGSQQWMFDTGAALKLRVLGMGLDFSYGRDLRNGNNAFYAEGLN